MILSIAADRLRTGYLQLVENYWAKGHTLARFCLAKVSGRVLTLAYIPTGEVVIGHTRPVMHCQSQWPCHELGLYSGWFGREGVGVVPSVRNVVHESDEAIV